MLQVAGYEVVTTPDGEAVYDLVLECKPDLVVLDIEFGNQQCTASRFVNPSAVMTPIFQSSSSPDQWQTPNILQGFERWCKRLCGPPTR